jgi:hypothetical protein
MESEKSIDIKNFCEQQVLNNQEAFQATFSNGTYPDPSTLLPQTSSLQFSKAMQPEQEDAVYELDLQKT